MKSIFKKAELILSDFHPEHSEFQMENFIIGAQGNEWAQYRQALRELAGRHPDMKNQVARILDLRDDLDAERSRWFRRAEKISRIKKEIKTTRESLKSKSREYLFFYKLARNLKRKIGAVTAQRRRDLETQMWVEKARRMAAVDLISINGLQRSTVEFIMSFPRELRRDILADLRPENRQKLLSILD